MNLAQFQASEEEILKQLGFEKNSDEMWEKPSQNGCYFTVKLWQPSGSYNWCYSIIKNGRVEAACTTIDLSLHEILWRAAYVLGQLTQEEQNY